MTWVLVLVLVSKGQGKSLGLNFFAAGVCCYDSSSVKL